MTIILATAGLLAIAAVMGGCAAKGLISGDGPTVRHAPDLSPTPPAAATPGVSTTRPEAMGAAADLAKAINLTSQLDYAAAGNLLGTLEGRLLLARDLPRAAEAAFWLAFCDEKLSRPDRAIPEYQRVVERYPQTPQARTAAERLERLLRKPE
ncbi:MAG: hypothetical protein PHU85_14210 [Phycisphaerae bacterium]|nr:hypothetical protein [Phycisphaerae bacterium]